MKDLVDYVKDLGYRNVEVKHASHNRIVLEADGWTIEIRKKGPQVYVKAFKVNPQLAAKIWTYITRKLKLY